MHPPSQVAVPQNSPGQKQAGIPGPVFAPDIILYEAGDKSTEGVSGYTHGIFRFGHAFAPVRS
jgi:hypothetical protein